MAGSYTVRFGCRSPPLRATAQKERRRSVLSESTGKPQGADGASSSDGSTAVPFR